MLHREYSIISSRCYGKGSQLYFNGKYILRGHGGSMKDLMPNCKYWRGINFNFSLSLKFQAHGCCHNNNIKTPKLFTSLSSCNLSIIIFLSHLFLLLRSSCYKMIFPDFFSPKQPPREGGLVHHPHFLSLGTNQLEQ